MATMTMSRGDTSLGVVTSVEIFRSWRGTLPWLMLISPVVIAIPMLLGTAITGNWQTFGSLTLTGWGTVLPVLIGLAVGLSVHQDNDAWLFLLASPVSRTKLVLGKFFALIALTLVATVVLAATVWIGALEAGVALPVSAWGAVCVMWLSSLGISGIMLTIALSAGFPVTVGVGAISTLAGALTADKSIWFLIPFGWPLRSMLPFGQVHASGTPLPTNSALMEMGPVYGAIGLSLTLAIISVTIACFILKRKEI